MYPDRYRLPQVTEHVLALLERRRPGHEVWDDLAETQSVDEAKRALAEVELQFRELAEDPGYWERLEQAVLQVAVPRYLRLARDQHELEKRAYGTWRGGDLISRLTYAGIGLLGAVIVARTAIPDWLEPAPLALLLAGPFIPDLQEWFARRRYARKLTRLVDEMKDEQRQLEAYRSLEPASALPPISEPEVLGSARTPDKERE